MFIGLCFLIQFFFLFQTSNSDPDTYLHLHVEPGAALNTFQAPLQPSRSGIDYGLNIEKQNGATEVPPSTEASLDQSGDEIHGLGVNCGGHRADSCSICPQDGLGWRGYTWCNGDCEWRALMKNTPVDGVQCSKKDCPLECLEKKGPTVSCGAHRAATCFQCSLGEGEHFCNGDCAWRTILSNNRSMLIDPYCAMKSIDYANDDDEESRDYKHKGGGKRGKKGKSKRGRRKTTPKRRKTNPRKARARARARASARKWAPIPGWNRKSVIPESQRRMAETSSDYGLPPSAGGWNQQNCADPDWNRQFCNCIASCAQGEYACEVACNAERGGNGVNTIGVMERGFETAASSPPRSPPPVPAQLQGRSQWGLPQG